LDEVLATFRSIGEAQARFGEAAAHRYVISFTASPRDVTDVLDLARFAGEPVPTLDVVPLFESAEALAVRRADPRGSSSSRRATATTSRRAATARR
jgi:phosphoenolpyruvate carboxylase